MHTPVMVQQNPLYVTSHKPRFNSSECLAKPNSSRVLIVNFSFELVVIKALYIIDKVLLYRLFARRMHRAPQRSRNARFCIMYLKYAS